VAYLYVLVFVPQQYIVPTPIYVQPSHFYSCHTRYCHNHNHITTQPSRRHCTYIYYIYTSFSQTVFVWKTIRHLCAPLLLCKCSIGCYTARQHQHTRAQGTRLRSTTRGMQAHARTAGPAMRCQSSGGVSQTPHTAQRDIPG